MTDAGTLEAYCPVNPSKRAASARLAAELHALADKAGRRVAEVGPHGDPGAVQADE